MQSVQVDADSRNQELQIGASQLIVCGEFQWRRFHTFPGAEDFLLNGVFFRIRQLETTVPEYLDAVVAIRIVRRGNHHSGGKSPGAREVSYSWRGNHTRG